MYLIQDFGEYLGKASANVETPECIKDASIPLP